MNNEATDKVKLYTKKRQKVGLVLLVILLGASLHMRVLMQIPSYSDFWAEVFYQPTEQIQALQDSLDLTDAAKKIWSATDPEYKNAEEFNEVCDSHNESINVLGCYLPGEDRIYLYEVTSERLVDANKVTVAHELLHAIWSRLDSNEQSQIERALNELYIEYQEWFDEELEIYDEDERLDEMYTRAGTKLADLTPELEAHYAKYFNDRAKIVAYYENYQTPFNELTQQVEALEAELTQLDTEIETDRASYRSGTDTYNRSIEEFNQCADTAGCFTEYAFNTRRTALLTEGERLENLRTELNNKVDNYNEKLEIYQGISREIGNLYAEMNSNARIENNEE